MVKKKSFKDTILICLVLLQLLNFHFWQAADCTLYTAQYITVHYTLQLNIENFPLHTLMKQYSLSPAQEPSEGSKLTSNTSLEHPKYTQRSSFGRDCNQSTQQSESTHK